MGLSDPGGIVADAGGLVRLADHEIGSGTGLQRAQIFKAEDAVVGRIGHVEPRRIARGVKRHARIGRTGEGEVEFAAFDEVRRVAIVTVLAQQTYGGRESVVRERQHQHAVVSVSATNSSLFTTTAACGRLNVLADDWAFP